MLTYNLAKDGRYRYLGISLVSSSNGIQSLIGLPTSASSTATESNEGLCDYHWGSTTKVTSFSILHGGHTGSADSGGAFYLPSAYKLDDASSLVGFRSMFLP